MELHVVIYNEVTLTWKCEWLIPIEWYDYIEMINRMIWLYRDDIWYYEWKWTEWNEMDLIIPIVDIDKIVYSSWFYDCIWIWMKWDRMIFIYDTKGIWEWLFENCVILWYLLLVDRIWMEWNVLK